MSPAALRLPDHVLGLARRLDSDGLLPAYVYDLAALDAHAAGIRAALPPAVQFYYAVKANPDAAVLRTVARHADGFEVSSGGELAHAAAAAPECPLAFGGPGKTEAELAAAIRTGTARFHVESPHELARLAATAQATGRPADILLRVNPSSPGVTAPLVMGGKPSPFGMDIPLLRRCAESLTGMGFLRLRGLHAHLASGLGAADLLAAAGTAWTGRNSTSAAAWRWTTPGPRRCSTGPPTGGAWRASPGPARRCGSSRGARSPPIAAGT
jgi:diaminopimelate decarboxylase